MEVPRDLYERLVEAAVDLQAQIGYMKDEPIERWQRRWQETCQLVDEAVKLRDAAERDCHSATRLRAQKQEGR